MPDSTPISLPVIAILGGTGKEGTGLALRWASVGYKVIIGSRQAEKAQAAAAGLNAKLGKEAVVGLENNQAAFQAQICILTVVQSAHQEAVLGLKEALKGKILVDATARVDFREPLPPAPPSAARIAQNILGEEIRVAAAFQNVPAHSLGKNLGGSLDADVLVCADDERTAAEIITLAEAAGMRGYFAGGLENAIVIEGLTSILISLNKNYRVKTASISITGVEHAP
jgi:NADPH-dependent F420 reductase